MPFFASSSLTFLHVSRADGRSSPPPFITFCRYFFATAAARWPGMIFLQIFSLSAADARHALLSLSFHRHFSFHRIFAMSCCQS